MQRLRPRIHQTARLEHSHGRWCDGGRTQHSRLGTLTDKAVKTAKRQAAEATLGMVQIENNVLDSFEYLGSRLQCDGDDEADVRYRMDIAQAAFASLSHLWMDHRLSRNMKLRLYNLCICSTLTHSCEAWNLTKAVSRGGMSEGPQFLRSLSPWLPQHVTLYCYLYLTEAVRPKFVQPEVHVVTSMLSLFLVV